jgi:hypothetical protein
VTHRPVPVSCHVAEDGYVEWFLGNTMLMRVDTPANVDATLGELGADRADLAFPDDEVRRAFENRFGHRPTQIVGTVRTATTRGGA